MLRTPAPAESRARVHGFTIGICASGAAGALPRLVRSLSSEPFPDAFLLKRIVIVASGCSAGILDALRLLAKRDGRILLIEEPVRRGKAEAINRIIDKARDDYLVFLNSDALPDKGAISVLLRSVKEEDGVGVVSAAPYFEARRGLVSEILQLIWSLHNYWSLSLNHAGLNNHASDELMAVNPQALHRLPRGLINDGAYIAGLAYQNGFSIRFSEIARVRIDVPPRLTDLIGQRRRIIFGHFQVWRWLGQSPRIAELSIWSKPLLSMRLVVNQIASTPRFLRTLPIAVVSETLALLLAIKDTMTSTSRHTVWRRYGDQT